MSNSAKKRKTSTSAKKKRSTAKQTRVKESLNCLLELHKLQGVLLEQLGKEF